MTDRESGDARVPSATATEARELLRELLDRFDLDEAHRRRGDASASKRARVGVPDDPAAQLTAYHVELASAVVVLRELAAESRALLERAHRPTEYAAKWRAIVERWNDAIHRNGWEQLPPLCEVCGVPVLQRTPQQLKGGAIEHSTVCSEKCRHARRQREHRRRK